ncbi:hypothetical protein [Salaquimonas pukyongi]|uniref:hypothetical protein n=1 Tax=Salaquimonas pukyongi TaxID=2712698 RepID=UPI0012EC4B67|nr:hypothetical protein [Salaquimonas pukyongi]
MATDKNTSKPEPDRRKQALRENLKRRKGALRGITAKADSGEAPARPQARHDALKPRNRGKESGS